MEGEGNSGAVVIRALGAVTPKLGEWLHLTNEPPGKFRSKAKM